MKTETYRGKYKFVVKEHGDGTAWIVMEVMGVNIPCLSRGFMGFDLKQRIDLHKAQSIASYLNEYIVGIVYTEFTTG